MNSDFGACDLEAETQPRKATPERVVDSCECGSTGYLSLSTPALR